MLRFTKKETGRQMRLRISKQIREDNRNGINKIKFIQGAWYGR